jgi:hypothetical protein
MMSLKNQALVFNFISFALLFIFMRYVIIDYFSLVSLMKSIISAVIATILAPKFMVSKTNEGSKLMLKWIFIKGFKTL